MLSIRSKGNKSKYQYVVLHYNEIFTNDTLKKLVDAGLEVNDMTPYSIKENYDFFMFKFTGDLPKPDGLEVSEVEVVYSKCKFSQIIGEHANELMKKGVDLHISENLYFDGSLNI